MIPQTKLVLNGFDLGKMTLAQVPAFASAQPGENIFDRVMVVRQILLDHSEWSRDEVMAITINELDELAVPLGQAMQDSAVPKANGRRSKIGRGSKAKLLPAG